MEGNSKPKVAVVTDSCASIPEQLIEALDIHWVPYYIHRGQEVLRDLVNIQREAFYAWLPTARALPTTASPGPGDYITLYEKLARELGTREIASLHMTSKGSGAYQAAMVAKSMVGETMPDLKVEVIDTLNVSMCQGWMVIEAARAALEGKSLASIVELVKGMIPLTRMIQTADTLKYLYMGGRIGRAKHLVGSLLNIKPLISIEDGVIVALGQARGRQQAYQKMVELIEAAVGPGGKIKIAYVHAAAQEEAEKIKALVEARLTCVESLMAELSPVLGVHSGPGTAGVCYFPLPAE
ncbi:MAG: DegV family protein [Thermoflexales bacterium]|nr:DegV family protein [Thermoflexales bacterium]